jgi:hypothetical protein
LIKILDVCLVALGILIVVFSERFGKWWNRIALQKLRMGPWANLTGAKREQAENEFYRSTPWRFWVWGVRGMGVLIALFGVVSLVG